MENGSGEETQVDTGTANEDISGKWEWELKILRKKNVCLHTSEMG